MPVAPPGATTGSTGYGAPPEGRTRGEFTVPSRRYTPDREFIPPSESFPPEVEEPPVPEDFAEEPGGGAPVSPLRMRLSEMSIDQLVTFQRALAKAGQMGIVAAINQLIAGQDPGIGQTFLVDYGKFFGYGS